MYRGHEEEITKQEESAAAWLLLLPDNFCWFSLVTMLSHSIYFCCSSVYSVKKSCISISLISTFVVIAILNCCSETSNPFCQIQ
uniref:Uncharacterized protein n=1 Tax=Kalanchoe fedtschenkoi TaxID=63787 RepID=A0A7N0TF00_KALFE